MPENNMELTHEIHLNRDFFEKIFVVMQQFGNPLELGQPAQITIDYDPNRPSVCFKYFRPCHESDGEESR